MSSPMVAVLRSGQVVYAAGCSLVIVLFWGVLMSQSLRQVTEPTPVPLHDGELSVLFGAQTGNDGTCQPRGGTCAQTISCDTDQPCLYPGNGKLCWLTTGGGMYSQNQQDPFNPQDCNASTMNQNCRTTFTRMAKCYATTQCQCMFVQGKGNVCQLVGNPMPQCYSMSVDCANFLCGGP